MLTSYPQASSFALEESSRIIIWWGGEIKKKIRKIPEIFLSPISLVSVDRERDIYDNAALIKPKTGSGPPREMTGSAELEPSHNEENISTLPQEEEEDPRFFRPESDPRRPERDQATPEEGPEKIGRQLRR